MFPRCSRKKILWYSFKKKIFNFDKNLASIIQIVDNNGWCAVCVYYIKEHKILSHDTIFENFFFFFLRF